MKGNVTLKVLEVLASAASGTGDLFVAFINAGYGASMSKIEYELKRKRGERSQGIVCDEAEKARERYYSFVYKLKRDGLIAEKNSDIFSLTKKGKEKLSALRNKAKKALPKPSYYEQESSNKIVVVIFDIPEKEKRKRNWLRSVLRKLGLILTQKSVWIGKVKIPKEFIDDLADMKILNYVEIFEITKAGSLRQIT